MHDPAKESALRFEHIAISPILPMMTPPEVKCAMFSLINPQLLLYCRNTRNLSFDQNSFCYLSYWINAIAVTHSQKEYRPHFNFTICTIKYERMNMFSSNPDQPEICS